MEQKQGELMKPRLQSHCLIVEGRRHVRITGVIEVAAFQEEEAMIVTQAGVLCLFGSELHLGKLDPEEGQVLLDGNIVAMEYQESEPEKRGLFAAFRGK